MTQIHIRQQFHRIRKAIESKFRFNRSFYPVNTFRSLLGLVGNAQAPTYQSLYSGERQHP